jgi:hypothetical protein
MQTNDFKNYIFIYKDSRGAWSECKNPQFIARHTCCRAIPLDKLLNLWEHKKAFLNYLDDSRYLDIEITEEQRKFLSYYIV